MALNYKAGSGDGDFKPCPAGNHIAVCDIIADLGVQPGGKFGDKHQVYIRYEIPGERIEYSKDGKKYDMPAIIGRRFTASMHEKAGLRIMLESWRGKRFDDPEAEGFDIETVLGVGGMANVVHNVKEGKLYANLASLAPLPKGIPKPKAENELIIYSPDHPQNLAKLPEWLQKVIGGQVNIARDNRDKDAGYVIDDGTYITDDDVPF